MIDLEKYNMPDEYLQMGNAAYQAHNWEQAMWWFEIAVKSPHATYLCWDNLSMTYYHLKNKPLAAQAARKALEFPLSEKTRKRIKNNLWGLDPKSVNSDPEYYNDIWKKKPNPRSLEKLRIKLMAKILNEAKPQKILDVGAGPGWILDYLNYKADYCGVDFSSEARKIIEKKGGKAVDSLDEINDFDWDACILGEVLEHIDDDIAFLKKIQRKVRRGSLIIVSVPRYKKMIDPAHVRDYTVEELERILKLLGDPVRVEHNLKKWEIYTVIADLPHTTLSE